MNCRFCGSALKDVFLDLHHSPPSNSFLNSEQLNEYEVYYPLKVMVCRKCFLVQIEEYKKFTEIFDDSYVYFSSYSKTWLDHAEKYVKEIIRRLDLNSKSFVVEIASNDGYLLQFVKRSGIHCLGIEPTHNTAEVARSKGIETLTTFFNSSTAKKISSKYGRAELIIANNVLAHVPDINDFVSSFALILKENGTVTFEFPHFVNLLIHNQFDTIYHEHYSYLSLITTERILSKHELRVYDVEEIPTHGGSLRVFVTQKESCLPTNTHNLEKVYIKERKACVEKISSYKSYQDKVNKVKNEFMEFMIAALKKGKTFAAYGAAAKGNTFLNYCGLKVDMIPFVVDVSPNKQGKYLPGSHIPVVSEEKLKYFKPDYILILPWNIREEIMSQLDYVRDWNAKFVTAIPSLEIK